MFERPSHRKPNEMRPVRFTTHYTMHAEGSVLVEVGNTKVICTASVIEGKPKFLKDRAEGWVTAEYGLLPRATHTRCDREAAKGKQSGRTMEIQRLIGRALRAVVDRTKIDNFTIQLDCDVIQADGGTRVASVSGGFVALYQAISKLLADGTLSENPIREFVAAVSCDICDGEAVIDVDYGEDSTSQVDMNFVLTESGKIVEIQGTAEGEPFSEEEFCHLLELGKSGIKQIISKQKEALKC